jgi:hypothetical protein
MLRFLCRSFTDQAVAAAVLVGMWLAKATLAIWVSTIESPAPVPVHSLQLQCRPFNNFRSVQRLRRTRGWG